MAMVPEVIFNQNHVKIAGGNYSSPSFTMSLSLDILVVSSQESRAPVLNGAVTASAPRIQPRDIANDGESMKK